LDLRRLKEAHCQRVFA